MTDHTQALESQVGGHPGVLSSEDGSLIIKPSLHSEFDFYQTVSSDDEYISLRSVIPRFYGMLKLEGKVNPDDETLVPLPDENGSSPQKDKQSIVLENISAPFKHPNILDIKLGTVLYEPDASPEKQERMTKTAHETTSAETGIRLTGFQVYDHSQQKSITTPKSYGKSIKPSSLPEGIRKFFPLSPHSEAQGQGLPKDLLLPVLKGIHSQVSKIRSILASTELTMIGGSLLIVYEADLEGSRVGLEYLAAHPEEERGGDEEVKDEEEDEDEDVQEGDESDGDSDSDAGETPLPYVVKLIDFAHTHFVPGQGADERLLVGVDTTLRLLAGRIEEVEKS